MLFLLGSVSYVRCRVQQRKGSERDAVGNMEKKQTSKSASLENDALQSLKVC